MDNPKIPSGRASPTTGVVPTPASIIRPISRELPVRTAPREVEQADKPIRLEGTVISSDPQTQTLKIATAKGEVVVQSSATYPPNTPVAVDLYMQKSQLVANVTVLRPQDAPVAAPATPEPEVPLPPLQAGDVVSAVLVSDSAPVQQQASAQASVAQQNTNDAPAAAQATSAQTASLQPAAASTATPVTEDQLVNILQQVLPSELAKLPGPLPLPAATLTQIVTAPDIRAALDQLPPQDLQKLLSYASQPNVKQALQNILPPEKFSALFPSVSTDVPVQGSASPPQTQDQSLLQVLGAQFSALTGSAKAVLTGTPSSGIASAARAPAAAPPSIFSSISNFLPVIETLLAAQKSAPVGQPGQAFVPPALPGVPQAAAGFALPQNLYQIKISGLLPPLAPAGLPAAATAPSNTPPASAAPPEPPLLPGQIAGKIESITPAGFPVISSAQGDFVLRTKAIAPVGSRVTFELTPLTAEQAAVAWQTSTPAFTVPVTPLKPLDPLISNNWPALKEAMQTLSASQPAMAQNIQASIPSPSSPSFAASTLFFLSALRSGDIQSWLGENLLQNLQAAGKKDVADMLSGDFQKLSTQSKNPVDGDWRMTSVPMQYDDQLSQVQVFVRQQQGQDDASGDDQAAGGVKKPMTRFLLNLHLSRMGAMQLDGLMHKKRLDLILRTEQPLDFPMRQELMQRYTSGIEQVNFQGSISFQTRSQGWVAIGAPQKGMMA